MPPVRDTVRAVNALADAGLPATHPALTTAGSWLLGQRIEGPADAFGPWSGAAASGWSFGRDGYPAAADTGEVLLSLSRINLAGLTGKPAITHAIWWLTDVQCRDGSWGHSATGTALVVQALATHGTPDAAAVRRGVVWLLRAQLPDGPWPGPDSKPDLTATTTVLTGLLVAGVLPNKPVVRNAVRWLLSRQNPDAGWSAAATGSKVQQPLSSDPAGTARAIAALVAVAGATTVPVEITGAVERGAGWLVRAQQADGGWSDGTGSGGNRGEQGAPPASRHGQRRRGSLISGLLLPLGALGQVIAPGRGGPDERPSREQGPRPLTETGLADAIGVSQ